MTAGLVSRVRAALDETERTLWIQDEHLSGHERPYNPADPSDPAAVLRLVASLREIVDAYEAALAEYNADPHPYPHGRLHASALAVRALAHGLGIDLEETT